MITRILVFAIISGIVIFVLSRKLKKHLICLVAISMLILFISLTSGTSLTKKNLNTVIDGAEFIGSYKEIGNVYYDENNNMYFVIEVNPWDIINTFKKTDIDYNLGEMVHVVSDIIEDAESLLENYN